MLTLFGHSLAQPFKGCLWQNLFKVLKVVFGTTFLKVVLKVVILLHFGMSDLVANGKVDLNVVYNICPNLPNSIG